MGLPSTVIAWTPWSSLGVAPSTMRGPVAGSSTNACLCAALVISSTCTLAYAVMTKKKYGTLQLHPMSLLQALLQSIIDSIVGLVTALFCCCMSEDQLHSKRYRVLLLGLDNAGKTALCHLLSQGWPSRNPRPQHHVFHHEFHADHCSLDLIDPSGDWRRCLALWEELIRSGPDAIVFVVDAADGARLTEARDALHWVLSHPKVKGLPVLVLGNKVDQYRALETWDLTCRLGLAGLTNDQREMLLGPSRSVPRRRLPMSLRRRISDFHPDEAGSEPHGGPLVVRMCSVAKRWSTDEGLRWLALAAADGSTSMQQKSSQKLLSQRTDGLHCSRGWTSAGSRTERRAPEASRWLSVFIRNLRGYSVLNRQALVLPLFHHA
mmetsp:Transcript_137818/g.239522  ORF Transcript_137818/g.239522 Transcript_137818/m.239522 type:complete len:378 (+) Transcript_137818:63-1196(+)